MSNENKFCILGQKVIENEIQAIANLKQKITASFAKACELLLNCQGHVVVVGMGKSGHIANKIAATLASTGTPAFFVHPSEACHGDLGTITKRNAVIAISNSGATPEILAITPIIKQLNVPLITITGNPHSPLAKAATINLDASIEKEACPLGLAPTSSTTATLVMGDALAIALLETRGFTEKDFALSHPGGSLGKRLLLKIDDIMRTGKAIPQVDSNVYLDAALIEVTAKTMGLTTIVDNHGKLLGVFTDGDLRRALNMASDIRKIKITEAMTYNCKTIPQGTLAYDALRIMEEHKITALIIINGNNEMVGITHIHDILAAGIT